MRRISSSLKGMRSFVPSAAFPFVLRTAFAGLTAIQPLLIANSKKRFNDLHVVPVVGEDGGNAFGAGTFECIDHQQQFHQVLIDGRANGLHHHEHATNTSIPRTFS